jgi:hypothetical protein
MNWHPEAIRVPYADAGPFVKAAPKLVWHTTQGKSLPTYKGSAPHFTFNPKTGQLWQHISLDRAAKGLEHPSGTVETNHANARQVELIGFSEETPNWPQADYARIAKLARWIELNASIPSRCGVTFTTKPHRLSPAVWLAYAGHLGHQHVPAQTLNHWDPGAFRIELVLAPDDKQLTAARLKLRALLILRDRLRKQQARTAARYAASNLSLAKLRKTINGLKGKK